MRPGGVAGIRPRHHPDRAPWAARAAACWPTGSWPRRTAGAAGAGDARSPASRSAPAPRPTTSSPADARAARRQRAGARAQSGPRRRRRDAGHRAARGRPRDRQRLRHARAHDPDRLDPPRLRDRRADGDGRRPLRRRPRCSRAAKERSKAQILFDMDAGGARRRQRAQRRAAGRAGRLAAGCRSPTTPSRRRSAHGGKSVDANLAGFAFGRGHARGELEQTVREHRKRAGRGAGRRGSDRTRARERSRPRAHDIVEEGMRRLADYQDRAYAALYLDRLDTVSQARALRPSCCARRRGISRCACRSRT